MIKKVFSNIFYLLNCRTCCVGVQSFFSCLIWFGKQLLTPLSSLSIPIFSFISWTDHHHYNQSNKINTIESYNHHHHHHHWGYITEKQNKKTRKWLYNKNTRIKSNWKKNIIIIEINMKWTHTHTHTRI